jgi:hypothetical protein
LWRLQGHVKTVPMGVLRWIMFLVPLSFILVRLHSFYELRLNQQDRKPTTLIRGFLLNTIFAALLSVIAVFIYLRTGSLLATFSIYTFWTWVQNLTSGTQEESASLGFVKGRETDAGNLEEKIKIPTRLVKSKRPIISS